MPCVSYEPNVIVCMRGGTWTRRILFCPTEKRRRRHVVNVEEWYGATIYCCGCGDSWQDGELSPRPFKRSWRKKAIAYARKHWEAAAPVKGAA